MVFRPLSLYQIIVTYIVFFLQAAIAEDAYIFSSQYFASVFLYCRNNQRYAISICGVDQSSRRFIVYSVITEVQAIEFYHSQYPNIVSNLIISGLQRHLLKNRKEKILSNISELLRRKEQLDELNDQKNRIISILSHDISAPLRSISGLAHDIREEAISSKEELDRFLPDVKSRLDKVSFLVFSLVRWSKSQMKGFTVQRVAIDVESLISENIALVKHFSA